MSAKYGGGTSASAEWSKQKEHKFPIIRIKKLNKESKDININIEKIEE